MLGAPVSAVFRRLVRQCSLSACWRQANVIPIMKGPKSYSVANCLKISIISLLPKVFEGLVSIHLGRFMERSGELPTTQLACRKGLGNCNVLFYVSYTLQ